MLDALGTTLRAAGLVPRSLAAWAGTDRVSALPIKLSGLAEREPSPAAAALALFVAGAELPIDRVRLPIEELIAVGLLERTSERVRSPVAVLPLGPSLIVCDRDDAEDDADLVCWPDDSSYHLTWAIAPGRRARWIDLGCGSAFAPLARPELASAITGVDINPRAVRYARLGAGLSGVAHLVIDEGDIGAPREPAELVTCNAPIPGEWDLAVWRRADDTFFHRLWATARDRIAPGGELIMHSRRSVIPDDLPGERVIVVYTPPGPAPFSILWWRPDAPDRIAKGYRELTPHRPHVDVRDREDLLAG